MWQRWKSYQRKRSKMPESEAVGWNDDQTVARTPKPPIFPANVNVASREDLLAAVDACLRAGKGFAVATLNLDHVVKLRRNAAFRKAYRQQTYVVADGNPIVWLSRIAGRHVSLVPGSEMVRPLCAVAAQANAKVALIGTTPEALDRAASVLEDSTPGLRIVAKISPAYGFTLGDAEFDRCMEVIRSSGAQLCLLALGAPKQEEFAARALDLAPGVGFVSIGAGLDFLAGTQVRAPKFIRAVAMEWLWRMVRSPKRLTGRYLACIVVLPSLLLTATRARFAGEAPRTDA